MKYFLYILHSKTLDRFYIGSTNNIEIRLIQHNRPHKGYTSAGQPWILVYSEEFSSKKDALIRERSLKKRKDRSFIEQLIKQLDA